MANKYEKLFECLIRRLNFKDFYYIPNYNDAFITMMVITFGLELRKD